MNFFVTLHLLFCLPTPNPQTRGEESSMSLKATMTNIQSLRVRLDVALFVMVMSFVLGAAAGAMAML